MNASGMFAEQLIGQVVWFTLARLFIRQYVGTNEHDQDTTSVRYILSVFWAN